MVTIRALEDDIDAYVSRISSMHGDPFRMVTEGGFAAGAAALKRRIRARQADSLSLLEAYYVLQELAATLQDEHTEILFPHHWDDGLGPMFPLRIRIFGDRAYVEECLGSDTIPPFAEVVSIEGVRVQEMLEEVLPYQSQTLVHFKRRAIESTFGRWLQAYFGLRSPWSLTYGADGRLETVEVGGMSSDAHRAAAGQPQAYSASAMTVGDLQVPILKILSFSPRNVDAYKGFVDRFFATNQDMPYVVIDVRDNPGGAGSLGWYVLDHLTEEPYEVKQRMTYVVSEEYKAYLNWDNRRVYGRRGIPRFLWWLPLYRRMDLYLGEDRERLLRAEVGSRIDAHLGTRIREVTTTPYDGTVFVLTSHGSNSAAVVFAAAFKAAGLGLIVGQETGGRETFSSDPVYVELPNTHLRAKVPVALLVLPGGNPDRGVLPDLPVEHTIDDLRRGLDPDLDAVRAYIEAAGGP
ncbi:S41 family peptidase [Gemmatimonadota bacterium]